MSTTPSLPIPVGEIPATLGEGFFDPAPGVIEVHDCGLGVVQLLVGPAWAVLTPTGALALADALLRSQAPPDQRAELYARTVVEDTLGHDVARFMPGAQP